VIEGALFPLTQPTPSHSIVTPLASGLHKSALTVGKPLTIIDSPKMGAGTGPYCFQKAAVKAPVFSLTFARLAVNLKTAKALGLTVPCFCSLGPTR
jgi:hypothetical protein